MFGDAATFINKDCRVLFGNIFIESFLGSALGYLIQKCRPGVGKFGCIWLEWFARVGREFDGKFLKNVKSPPLAHKKSSTYFLVLLAILLDKTYVQLRVNYRPSLQLFPFYVFPALFSAWMKARPSLKAKAPNRKSRKLLLFTMRMTLVKTPHQPCFQYLVLYRQVRPPQ